jgi:hypothetical protein
MIDSYWDLYVAYVDKCVRDNWINDIDPHHYDMEWNHFLPKSVFGDQPIGQWLSLKQHAIASALQTLVFRRNCMFSQHKDYLPDYLLELAWPYYTKMCADNGRTSSVAMNTHENTAKQRKMNGQVTGAANQAKIPKEILVAAGKAGRAKMPIETLVANQAKIPKEILAANGTSNIANMPRERKAAGGKASAGQMWQCLVTDHISNPGGLTAWQKARGIDIALRVKLEP